MACCYLVVKLACCIVPEFATAARGRGSAMASINDESSNFTCTKSSIELAILPARSGHSRNVQGTGDWREFANTAQFITVAQAACPDN